LTSLSFFSSFGGSAGAFFFLGIEGAGVVGYDGRFFFFPPACAGGLPSLNFGAAFPSRALGHRSLIVLDIFPVVLFSYF
jgi:hypothetical protein